MCLRFFLDEVINERLWNLVSAFVLGVPSEGRVKCSYIEKESIPTVWTVSMIFVITGVFDAYIYERKQAI